MVITMLTWLFCYVVCCILGALMVAGGLAIWEWDKVTIKITWFVFIAIFVIGGSISAYIVGENYHPKESYYCIDITEEQKCELFAKADATDYVKGIDFESDFPMHYGYEDQNNIQKIVISIKNHHKDELDQLMFGDLSFSVYGSKDVVSAVLHPAQEGWRWSDSADGYVKCQ